MVCVQPFTPSSLASLPRRSDAVPNHNGSLALYSVILPSGRETRVVDLKTRKTRRIEGHAASWIPGTNDVLFLRGDDKVLVNAAAGEYLVAEVAGCVGFRIVRVNDGVAFVAAKQHGTKGVRVFDESATCERNTLCYNLLQREGGSWTLAGDLINVAGATVAMEFSLSARGIAAADVSGRPYFFELESYTRPAARPARPITLADHGAVRNLRISPDGTTIAFIQAGGLYTCWTETLLATSVPDAAPATFEFAGWCDRLIVCTVSCGRSVLSTLDLHGRGEAAVPFFEGGCVSSFWPLAHDSWDSLLVSSSSLLNSKVWSVVDVPTGVVTPVASTREGVKFAVGECVSDFWYEASQDCLHAWTARPADFTEGKTYPWVVVVNDGPALDQWDAQCNPVMWAQQGYVVFCPDISEPRDLANLVMYIEHLPYLGKGVIVGDLSPFLSDHILAKFCCAVWTHSHRVIEDDTPWVNVPPCILPAGQRDYSAPLMANLLTYNKLRAHDVQARLVLFEEEGQVLESPGNLRAWLDAMLDWVGGHLA